MGITTRPVIGVSAAHHINDKRFSIAENYFAEVIRAGGLPVLLPQTDDPALIGEILSHIDGLLLSGGGDIDPARYGEERQPECGQPSLARDEFELQIASRAKEMGMPVFGICRGVQILAVLYGSTLIQDIEKATGIPRITHYQPEPHSAPHHAVHLTPVGLFERILGTPQIISNSMHHQSIRTPGKGLVIEGTAADGIVECIADAENESIFGVQFHPECMGGNISRKLFNHFLKYAQIYRDNRK